MKKKKGFTLVEIMIVVSIIGILIAIAVPGFIRARINSRRTACQSNQTKLDGAVTQYILDARLNNLAETPLAGLPATDPLVNDIIVGRNEYMRSIPRCPGNGIYTILAQEDDAGSNIECSLWDDSTNEHTFPGGVENQP